MCFKYIPNDDIICTLFEFSMANVHKENCIKYIYKSNELLIEMNYIIVLYCCCGLDWPQMF